MSSFSDERVYSPRLPPVHGYIDSFPVPMRLPVGPGASKGGKGKGKAKDQDQPKLASYSVVDSWTAQERDDVERKIAMAALREFRSCRPPLHSLSRYLLRTTVGYSTIILTMTILPTTNPSTLVFPTPLFPTLDPRTAKPGTQGMVLQLWRIEVGDYTEESIKGTSVKGFYGFVRSRAWPLHLAS